MFNKNLKYYRLKNAMSKKELAEQIHVSPMAISNYENGKRKPDMDLLKQMAKVLGVRVSDFLAIRDEKLAFCTVNSGRTLRFLLLSRNLCESLSKSILADL